MKFKNGQKVIYTAAKIHVEATVFDVGIDMSAICILSMDYNMGNPTVLTTNNSNIVDKNEYISLSRDSKIGDIIN